MYGESQLPEAMEEIAPKPLPVAPELPNSLKEVRELRRRIRVGVYVAVLVTLVFDFFVLGFSNRQMAVMAAISLVISTAAVEGAFVQAFKIRKQSAYPRVLIVQLSEVKSSAVAYQAGLAVLNRLLNLSGSVLCLLRSDSLSLVALSGVSRRQTDHFLRLGAANVREAIETSTPVAFQPGADLLAQAALPEGQVLVFVPVRSLQGPVGVLGLLARESNRDLRDQSLLMDMGLALGLSLENLRQKEELGQQAAMDELTGVYNRRYFFNEMNREIAFASRYSSPLAVAILDVDGLKGINDRLGHAAGDELLRAVALRLVRYSRASDLVARIGGDEFALILPRTDSQAAKEIAVRLQLAVEQHPVALADGQDLSVAVSCGTASFPEDAGDAEALLRRADAAMYCIKAARHQGASL